MQAIAEAGLGASDQILGPSGFLVPDISSTPHLMRAGYPLDALGSVSPTSYRGRVRPKEEVRDQFRPAFMAEVEKAHSEYFADLPPLKCTLQIPY